MRLARFDHLVESVFPRKRRRFGYLAFLRSAWIMHAALTHIAKMVSWVNSDDPRFEKCRMSLVIMTFAVVNSILWTEYISAHRSLLAADSRKMALRVIGSHDKGVIAESLDNKGSACGLPTPAQSEDLGTVRTPAQARAAFATLNPAEASQNYGAVPRGEGAKPDDAGSVAPFVSLPSKWDVPPLPETLRAAPDGQALAAATGRDEAMQDSAAMKVHDGDLPHSRGRNNAPQDGVVHVVSSGEPGVRSAIRTDESLAFLQSLRDGDLREAKRLIEIEARLVSPNDILLLRHQALYFAQLGDNRTAAEMLRRILAQLPDDENALANLEVVLGRDVSTRASGR